MTNRTIRFIIFFSAFILGGLIWLQVYWVQKARDFTEEQFDNRVSLALMSVAGQINRYNKDTLSVREPVSKFSSDYFTVDITNTTSPDHLENLLLIEFNRYGIYLDFQYVIYDCFLDSVIWSHALEMDKNGVVVKKSKPISPSISSFNLNKDSHRFGVFFPSKGKYISRQMGIMIYSSIGVFIIVLFFVYLLMAIFKQKKLSEIKTDFINNMTHEFKTPIATITVSSDQLLKESIHQNPEKVKRYAHIIKDEGMRLKSQVDQILNIAMFDSTRTKLKRNLINAHALIKNVVEKIRVRAIEKNCELKLALDAQSDHILGDNDHLTNVIFNLIDNALKYSTEDPLIQIRTYNKYHHLVIEIQDNGIGIPKEYQKMIFEKFYRVPTGNVHNVKGFGLGLSYVRKIVKLHGGKIELSSTPGIGTIFRIILQNNQ